MRTKLTKIGDSLSIAIDRRALSELGLDLESEVEVTIERGRLIIEPAGADADADADVGSDANAARARRILDAAKRAMDGNDHTMKRLAQ